VTSFEIEGQTGTRATVSLEVASDGELVFTPVST
jgi:hypothetical protein